MNPKFLGSIFFLLLLPNLALSQDWKPFNDTLVYYYQASNTGKYHTLRTREKLESPDDTLIYFVDNYIPCDTFDFPYPLYYTDRGSIFGDSLLQDDGVFWFDEWVQFYNRMEIGETLPFSSLSGVDITYVSTSDSTLFEVEDSVRYFAISDGTSLIQSKSFGFIAYPKQNSDSSIVYKLVGIEEYVGLSFNYHNEIFDFEIGDVFYYRVGFGNWIDDDTETYYSYPNMTVTNKFIINGMTYYGVESYAGDYYYPIYPPLIDGNSPFDYPGEQVVYCRADDVYSGPEITWALEDGNKFNENYGFGFDTTDEGRLVQGIAHEGVDEDYQTFGHYSIGGAGTPQGLNYIEHGAENLYGRSYSLSTYATYEEGFGLTHFRWDGHEQLIVKDIIAAEKSGIKYGDWVTIEEERLRDFKVYPNPASENVNFELEISEIKVFNSQGKLTAEFSDFRNSINIEDLPNGIYFIFGLDLNGEVKRSRFIKE